MVFQKKINVTDNIDLSQTKLEPVLKICDDSEQYILIEKYGLVSWKPTPMQQIGNRFDMSRERIRQILNRSLQKVRRLISSNEYFELILKKAQDILKKSAYVMKEDDLINNLMEDKDINLNYNELLLILSSDYDLYYLHRNPRFVKLFFLEPLFEELINDIHDSMLLFITQEGKSLSKESILSKFKTIFLNKFQRNQSIRNIIMMDDLYINIALLSKKLSYLDGKIGLVSYEDVNPKNVKSKIKFVLRKSGKPMHFEDIAKKIETTFNFKVKIPTIHNELVKTKDFINVGMWIYGLAEWWYNGENTFELIKNILKKAQRPMTIKELVKEVMKERMIKEVTVLLNLQRYPDIFERVGRGLYKLKDN